MLAVTSEKHRGGPSFIAEGVIGHLGMYLARNVGSTQKQKSKQNHRGNIKIKTAQPQETTTPLETEKCECNVILRLSWENKTQGKQGRSLSVWLTSPALSLLGKFTHHCSVSFYN